MTVLLFAGSDFYARSFFEDMVGTLTKLPTTEEVAAWTRRVTDSEEIFESPTASIDWISALDVTSSVDGSPMTRLGWRCVHWGDPAKMAEQGYHHIWQDSAGDWHGIIEAVNMREMASAPLTWPPTA